MIFLENFKINIHWQSSMCKKLPSLTLTFLSLSSCIRTNASRCHLFVFSGHYIKLPALCTYCQKSLALALLACKTDSQSQLIHIYPLPTLCSLGQAHQWPRQKDTTTWNQITAALKTVFNILLLYRRDCTSEWRAVTLSKTSFNWCHPIIRLITSIEPL